MVLKVHRSNFFMGGFVESPPAEAVAAVARGAGVPFVEDLGGGATFPTERSAGAKPAAKPGAEPASTSPRRPRCCGAGPTSSASAATSSSAGRRRGSSPAGRTLVAALKKEPFFRALRCDKLILAALQATVDLHLRGHGRRGAPGGARRASRSSK